MEKKINEWANWKQGDSKEKLSYICVYTHIYSISLNVNFSDDV